MRITKVHFSSVFSEAWIQALTPKNIMAGFRTTGRFPFNRNAIELPGDAVQNLSEITGIAFIPPYSPAKRCIPPQNVSTDKVEDSMLYEEDCDVSHACSPEQYRPIKRNPTMSYFLPTPTATPTAAKGSVLSKNMSSRVLTSAEENEREKERKKGPGEGRACPEERK